MEIENIPYSELSAICGEEDVETLKYVELHDEASGHVTSCHEEVIDDNVELLAVGMKFSTWDETQKAIDEFQKKKYCQFYVRDSRTLSQAGKLSPKLVQKVPVVLQYTLITFSCIHGGRTFKSRPKDGSRPQQM